MKAPIARACVVFMVLMLSYGTSTENSSQQCLVCPNDEYVGLQRSCQSIEVSDGRGWQRFNSYEIPVVDWSCKNSGDCQRNECALCVAFVEIQFVESCSPENRAHQGGAFGFPLSYADPFAAPSLFYYLTMRDIEATYY